MAGLSPNCGGRRGVEQDGIVSEDRLLDYFESRTHRGVVPVESARVGHRHPTCGDVVELSMLVEAGLIRRLRFEARGCVVSQAATAMLCEHLEGQPVDRLVTFTPREMLALVGLPLSPRRIPCALLPLEAARLLAAKLPPTEPATANSTEPHHSPGHPAT